MTLIIINGYGISTVNPKLEELENVYEHVEAGIRSLAHRDFYNVVKEAKTIAELEWKVRALKITGQFRILYLEMIEELYTEYVATTKMEFDAPAYWQAYKTALKEEENSYARYTSSSESET
ncbi:MAG: hypothetical protein E6446_00060 [Gemella haemolysans]|nr:hypothetical protein [Gemella haemolysans]